MPDAEELFSHEVLRKAARLVRRGKVTPSPVSPSTFYVKGDSGTTYRIVTDARWTASGPQATFAHCQCDYARHSRRRVDGCSHVAAAWITVAHKSAAQAHTGAGAVT